MNPKKVENILIGEDFNRKLEQIKEAFNQIELKYADWFKNRKTEDGKPDRLKNYWSTSSNSGNDKIYLEVSDKLPTHIIDECVSGFNALFIQ